MIYFTSKERLKEEANKMILDNKNEFFVKAVHVNCEDTDAAHKMLRKKSEKMDNDALKELMTTQVSIDKDKAHYNAQT